MLRLQHDLFQRRDFADVKLLRRFLDDFKGHFLAGLDTLQYRGILDAEIHGHPRPPQ